jgi:hypothetical protein
VTSTRVQPAQFTWTAEDDQAVTVARILAMDAVERAGHGHPGTAVSLAPAAHLLFQRFLRHDPTDPTWPGRDRFVLSCGHSSLTLYIQLYLTGYPLTLDDLRSYRRMGSRTPAHPEWGHTPGVETTTGPLGQGIATAVGMAMGARRERGLFEPPGAGAGAPGSRSVDMNWRHHAACRHEDPELFFPFSPASVAQAKTVCGECPVRAACLAYACATGQDAGKADTWQPQSHRSFPTGMHPQCATRRPSYWQQLLRRSLPSGHA